MTDTALIMLINTQPTLQTLADAGSDNALAAAVPALATVTQPVPVTLQALIASVSQSDFGRVVMSPMYPSIQAAIQDQDLTTLAEQAQVCLAAGFITQAELAALQTSMTATQQVPDTSVTRQQVSAVLNSYRPVDAGGSARVAPLSYPLAVPNSPR